MPKEDFTNRENHARLYDRIDKGIAQTVIDARKGDWPPSIRSDQPRDRNPHSHDAYSRIAPGPKAELTKLTPEIANRVRDHLRK
jgi:hypothetical protein